MSTKIKLLWICISILLFGCNESTLVISETDVNHGSIANTDTIIIPNYGTINILIPQREASVVNVEGYTENSFKCRVDLTKESPISEGVNSEDWIPILFNPYYPTWENGGNYYNNGRMYHYSETKENYYNDDTNKGSVNGTYDGVNNKYLHYDWPIDKTKHRGEVSIYIPGFLSGTYFAEIRFQGQSSLIWYPKKNFRIDLYTDESFKKKVKIQIGGLVNLSGYNIKAYYNDHSRLIEPIINNLIHKAYKTFNYQERYPWNESNPSFSGATGTIKGFPVKLCVNGEFYGVSFLCEKKDKGNYMLDGKDLSGLLVQGVGYQKDFWDSYIPTRFEDLIIDKDNKETPWVNGATTTKSNIEALTSFYDYFNNNLDKETAEKHFNKKAWIDYIIFLQVFYMFDNTANNIILYSDSYKTKFTPFFYDLDMSLLTNNANEDVFSVVGDNFKNDKTYKGVWLKLKDLWWKDIVTRYKFLRQEVLCMNVIRKTAYEIKKGINEYDFENDISKWNNIKEGNMDITLKLIEKRLDFCDDYFIGDNQ